MKEFQPEYRFEADGSFTLTHYNRAAPFSSFLPGLAGAWGIPMWAFYVNRGQGLCSFGIRDKDHPIAEFLSANWAYQLVFRQGFQTFIKIRSGDAYRHHEPFQMVAADGADGTQSMHIWPHQVGFRETHRPSGLAVYVTYFTLPQEPLAALVRSVRVRNVADRPAALQLLDGLAFIVPYGLSNHLLKDMRYIAQSHVEVVGLAGRTPGFRTKSTTQDSAVVDEVRGVNFCFGYEAGAPGELLLPIVDPAAVYGGTTDLSLPDLFLRPGEFRPPARQMTENRMPAAFLLARCRLEPGEERTFHFFFGHAGAPEAVARFAQRARSDGYVEARSEENRRLVAALTQPCATASGHPVFNAYTRQNLLDNALRGGTPVTLSRGKRPVVLPLFARKHGDLERDYNYFIVEPTPFSQGESNYRDINQNRRHNVFMNPEVGADDVVLFCNLLQADGFNPHHVQPVRFRARAGVPLKALVRGAVGSAAAADVLRYVTRDFELGRLFLWLREKSARLRMPREDFVSELLALCERVETSVHGQGYWTDHWSYNLDLIEAFRGVYPEGLADLLFRRREFVYCDTHVYVRPRSEKYVLRDGRPMQLDPLEHDGARETALRDRNHRAGAVRTRHGKGPAYLSYLAPKLLALSALKLASLDPFGVGIEMEADRPNWNDALNGLPGQFGSSLCETLELKRLVLLLQEALALAPAGFAWDLPVEIADLVRGLGRLMNKPPAGPRARRAFAFWDRACRLKETYRRRVRAGFSGDTRTLRAREVETFLSLALAKVTAGIQTARDRATGLYHTYFRHEVTGFQRGRRRGDRVAIRPTGFRQIKLPLFLEGQVHALRLERDPGRARELVRAVRQSGLFDRTLGMYKVNADLDREPKSIGRIRTFARGWLENESVWLHMEYKFLLEMLRAGLHPEFFDDFRHCAVPFMKPEVYGRSTLENCSFLVSDAYPDPAQVGKGYMARLSGATAEFIHMWLLMCCGERPFRTDAAGRLEACLRPSLPAWLFTTKAERMELLDGKGQPAVHDVPAGAFAFVFLGHTVVVYRQEGPVRDTFGPNAARVRAIRLTYDDGTRADVEGDVLTGTHATALRECKVRLVEARLG